VPGQRAKPVWITILHVVISPSLPRSPLPRSLCRLALDPCPRRPATPLSPAGAGTSMGPVHWTQNPSFPPPCSASTPPSDPAMQDDNSEVRRPPATVRADRTRVLRRWRRPRHQMSCPASPSVLLSAGRGGLVPAIQSESAVVSV